MLTYRLETETANCLTLLEKIMALAVKQGFNGLAGNCGQASIIMNKVLFNGTQTYAGCFNKALFEKGYAIGHIALYLSLPQDQYILLDVDGLKYVEDIEHWGMLDSSDADMIELFKQYGIPATDEAFDEVESYAITENDILSQFSYEDVAKQTQILSNACKTILVMDQFCLLSAVNA